MYLTLPEEGRAKFHTGKCVNVQLDQYQFIVYLTPCESTVDGKVVSSILVQMGQLCSTLVNKIQDSYF